MNTEWHDCDGFDDPIRHDQRVVEIVFGFNSHGALMAESGRENATCHNDSECIDEVLE